jgi:hypothetical protein
VWQSPRGEAVTSTSRAGSPASARAPDRRAFYSVATTTHGERLTEALREQDMSVAVERSPTPTEWRFHPAVQQGNGAPCVDDSGLSIRARASAGHGSLVVAVITCPAFLSDGEP